MRGLHVMVELRGCAAEPLCAGERVRAHVRELCGASGLAVVGETHHAFAGGGFTFALLLAESHVALHTWPELGCVTMDVYVCNYSRNNDEAARELAKKITALFSPAEIVRNEFVRGLENSRVFAQISSENASFAPQV
jgi:S-adenosylmethionine decarboxylase